MDIDFDKYITINKSKVVAGVVSKFPMVNLDYTVISKGGKYQDLQEALNNFRSNLIKDCELINVYENKYTIRYTLGSNKTLETKDLTNFKERFIKHIKENNWLIEE